MILSVLISLVIWGIIFYVLWWGLGKLGLPEPFNKVATVILVITTILVLIGILDGQVAPFGFLGGTTTYYVR